jgi:DNA polymerase III subunit delta
MTRQGFSFLVCADPELLKDRVGELLEGQGFAVRTFWGDEDLPPRYWQSLTVPSMMGPPNAVVLRRAQDQDDEFWSRMEPLLAMARPSVWPMFCLEGEWKSGKPNPPKTVTKGRYWAAAQKRGWIWEHPGLSRATIGRELDRFAARNNLTFASGVKKILAESLPLSTIALRGELEKIVLLAGEARPSSPSISRPWTSKKPSTSSPFCVPCRRRLAEDRPGTGSSMIRPWPAATWFSLFPR